MKLIVSQPKDDFLPAPFRILAPYLVLALVVFAAYGNIFDNAFVYDDDSLITNNDYLRGWNHIGAIFTSSIVHGAHLPAGFYRPLQILLYLFLFHLGDGSPFLFHLLNLSLHIANTCFVYKLGTKLKFKPWGVFLAALVWGIHPLNSEAVDYISAVQEPLFSFFCLWSVVILVPDFTPKKILKIVPLFLLGLMSKESMAMFPLLVGVCLYFTSSERLNIRTYFRTWPLWIISIIYMVWRLQAAGFDGPQYLASLITLPENSFLKFYTEHPLYRFYTFLATLPAYLNLLIWPHDLHMIHSFPFYQTVWGEKLVMMGVGIVLLAAVQIVRSGIRPSLGIVMGWGLLWFAAAHAPDSGILFPINARFLEHRMYLPSVGLFLGTAETLANLLHSRLRAAYACSVIVLTFAGLMFFKTYGQNEVWKDPVSFYINILRYNERSGIAHGDLGGYYTRIGKYTDAYEHLEQAIGISDNLPTVRYNLATTYLRRPDWRAHIPDAIANLQRSLELDPNAYQPHMVLGHIYDELGDKDKAKYHYDRANALLKF